MAQLGRFSYPVQDTSGNAVAGASVGVYREGATVNGNQSGASPTTFTVRHRGKIVTGDNVFVNAATGTLYAATVVSATQITLGGYVGTLSLTSGDRLTPSGSQPTLYSDDQGGSTTSNPLTSSSTGRVQCWIEYGAYDLVLSGGGLTATAFTSEVMPTEQPSRFLHAGSFGGLSIASVQAALNELKELNGGTVYIPSDAGIAVTTTGLTIPNRCLLVGTGSQVPGAATFTCSASTNVTAVIQNLSQDGTQQLAGLRNIQIDGNKASGALVTYGILYKRIFSGTTIDDCRVTNVSGIGIQLEGTTTSAGGPYWMRNTVVTSSGGDNIKILEGARQLVLTNIESDAPGATSACLRMVATTSSSAQNIGCTVKNIYMETTQTGQLGIVVDSCANVQIDGVTHAVPSGSVPDILIQIKGNGNFSGGTSGCTIRNVYAETSFDKVIIDDQTNGVQVKCIGSAPQPFKFVAWYSSPVATGTNGIQSQGQIVGIQYQKQGATITAAATITPLEGNYFVVNGNTGINSITASARDKGRIIVLHFSGTPTITDGSNLIMAGNLVATADDTLTMVCDGTNWIEMARSIN